MTAVFPDENQTCLKAAAAEEIRNARRAAEIWILFAFHGPVVFIRNELLFLCSLISTLFADLFS